MNADVSLAVERAALLIGPLLLAAALLLVNAPRPREAAAAMVAFLWQLPALLLIHLLARDFGFWRFGVDTNHLAGFPIDVWIGWAIWWGPIAALLTRWISPFVVVALFAAIDLATMPLLQPLIVLGPNWLVGEVVAVALALVPGLTAAELTRRDRHPTARALLHCLGWGGYMLLLLPLSALAWEGRDFLDHLTTQPAGGGQWFLVAVAGLLLVIGIAATAEFAIVGSGTPIPLDPPKRVVTTGPYAFLANPMQMISAAFMFVLALYVGSWSIAAVGLAFLVFDGVYAAWYNRAHIARAMPDAWATYKDGVEDWRPRWRPYVEGTTRVTISADGPMRWLWDRLWPRLSACFSTPIEIRDHRPDADVAGDRLVYERDEAGIREIGVLGAARLLEHGPMPVALIGWIIRLPLLGGALQLASGFAIRLFRL